MQVIISADQINVYFLSTGSFTAFPRSTPSTSFLKTFLFSLRLLRCNSLEEGGRGGGQGRAFGFPLFHILAYLDVAAVRSRAVGGRGLYESMKVWEKPTE